MAIREAVQTAVTTIAATPENENGGRDTTKIDSKYEKDLLSKMLSNGRLNLNSDEKEYITRARDGINKWEVMDEGRNVEFMLSHWTNKTDAKAINKKLENINADNVLSFLSGYYENDENPTEGLIEKLDDDATFRNDNGVTMTTKIKLLEAILEKASEQNKTPENNKECRTIKQIISRYKNEEIGYENKTEFNHIADRKSYWDFKGKWGSVIGGGVGCAGTGAGIGALIGGPVGAAIGGVVGAVIGVASGLADIDTDNEKLDDCIQKLYKDMVNE